MDSIIDAAKLERRRDPENRKRMTLRSADIAPDTDPGDLAVAFAEAQRGRNLLRELDRHAVLEFTDTPVSALAIKKAAEFRKDIANKHYSIDIDRINHAFNSHGPGNETDEKNEPISVEDFAMVPDVLQDPDKVVFHNEYEGKGASLEYRRRINGWLVVVEMITSEGSELNEIQFRTMWKEIGKGH
ncbi:MAG: hypothetical protein HOF33_04425 [Rhodospirillaceae bacterium]|nr:hypothetical protein [Rhodospirillaceae bacterium]